MLSVNLFDMTVVYFAWSLFLYFSFSFYLFLFCFFTDFMLSVFPPPWGAIINESRVCLWWDFCIITRWKWHFNVIDLLGNAIGKWYLWSYFFQMRLSSKLVRNFKMKFQNEMTFLEAARTFVNITCIKDHFFLIRYSPV